MKPHFRHIYKHRLATFHQSNLRLSLVPYHAGQASTHTRLVWSCMLMGQPPYCFDKQYLCPNWQQVIPPKQCVTAKSLTGDNGSLSSPQLLVFTKFLGMNYLWYLLLCQIPENQHVFQELLRIEQLTNNYHIKLDYYTRTEQFSVKTCRAVAQLNIFVTYLFCNFLLKQKKIIYIC